MAFLSYGKIEKLASEVILVEKLAKVASELDGTKIVFLSHSSKDKRHLIGVVKFFEKFKAPVYVDEGDKNLPVTPSPATAEILKNNINGCPRFIVLVSPNSRDSKWIPWELGLADAFKGVAKVALLPITPTSEEEAWASQEYLGLYPRIIKTRQENYANEVWTVFDPRDRKNWELKYWLHNDVN